MHSRSRSLRVADPALSGPLLVPSVSSKGFPLVEGVSEAGLLAQSVGQDLTKALLVSAYDLHHRLLPDAERLLGSSFNETMYATPALLIVDSGGYELNTTNFEAGETRRDPYVSRPYGRMDFEAVADALPKDRHVMLVSYDEPVRAGDPSSARAGYRGQREQAQEFFAERPWFRSDFLIKPEGLNAYLDMRALTAEVEDLRVFDVVGVTEPELGGTLLDRLAALASLRALLDGGGCAHVPIHIFGCLDPVLTPLYFMAGGEIFDGLSWLRYAYIDNVSVHPEQLAVLTGRSDEGEQIRNLRRLMSNLDQLGKLHHSLARWHAEPDRYDHLGLQSERLREIYDNMRAQLAQRGQ